MASDRLLGVHGIYIQPINYPTVARGTERLRITPTPFHSDELIAGLQDALVETWDALGIPYGSAGRPSVTKSDRIVALLVPKSGG
jgi:5-aminolevulinate synthase